MYNMKIVEDGFQSGSATLMIYSDTYSPDEITEIMQTEPTHTVAKGALISKATKSYAPHNGWFYKEQSKNNLDGVDDAMNSVARVCLNAIERLNRFKDLDVRLNCYINSDLAQAGFEFSPDTVSLLSQIGRGLEISLFSWGGVEINDDIKYEEGENEKS